MLMRIRGRGVRSEQRTVVNTGLQRCEWERYSKRSVRMVRKSRAWWVDPKIIRQYGLG